MKPFIALLLTLSPVWAQQRMLCYPEHEAQATLAPSKDDDFASTDQNYVDTSTASTSSGLLVIPVVRDGETCPDGTYPSGDHQGMCDYGGNTGTIPSGWSGKCCYNDIQKMFLYSVKRQGKKDTSTEYVLDGRPCCALGTEGAALTSPPQGGRSCEYGNHMVEVLSPDYVTKCCWKASEGNFVIHMKEPQPFFTIPINNGTTKRIYENIFNHQDVGIQIHTIEIYGYYLAVKAKLWTGGFVNWSEEDEFDIHLDHDWKVAKNWFPGSSATGHISMDAVTKVNDDNTLDAKLHITGTGLLFGHLEETIGPFHLDIPELKQGLVLMKIC